MGWITLLPSGIHLRPSMHVQAHFDVQVALNRVEILSSLEEVAGTITKNMADSQFYASVYVSSLQMDLDSTETTDTFRETLNFALPKFYAAVLVFSVKARSYFLSAGLGMNLCL